MIQQYRVAFLLQAAASSALMCVSTGAMAVEGGTGHYLLGSRDILSGIVPPPGVYLSVDSYLNNSNIDKLSIGGAILANADAEVLINKVNFTKSFAAHVLGGRPAVTITMPVVTGQISFDSPRLGPNLRLKDEQTGFGDAIVTPSIGWDKGTTHIAAAMSVFFPVGYYNVAQIDIPGRDLKALSFGKNRMGFTPALSITHLPKSGLEMSLATSISFSTKNQATDYQTAPEFQMEGAIAQHFGPKFALGVQGYFYQQLGEDSGSGADAMRAALGAESLQARVASIGPLASYSTKIGSTSFTLKGKFIHEFAGKRRFEGDLFQLSVALGF